MKIVSPAQLTGSSDCSKPHGFLSWRTSQSLNDSNVQSEREAAFPKGIGPQGLPNISGDKLSTNTAEGCRLSIQQAELGIKLQIKSNSLTLGFSVSYL